MGCCPTPGLADAILAADRARTAISALPFATAGALTMSAGVGVVSGADEADLRGAYGPGAGRRRLPPRRPRAVRGQAEAGATAPASLTALDRLGGAPFTPVPVAAGVLTAVARAGWRPCAPAPPHRAAALCPDIDAALAWAEAAAFDPERGQIFAPAVAAARDGAVTLIASHQTINITPKVAEVDGLLRARPERQEWLAECHPELSFRVIAGRELLGKRAAERRGAASARPGPTFPDAAQRSSDARELAPREAARRSARRLRRPVVGPALRGRGDTSHARGRPSDATRCGLLQRIVV